MQTSEASETIPNQSAAMPVEVSHTVQFTGEAGEFFRIWIVNLMLTVLTVGIYSAWATVRTRRYFYANTRLTGHAFEYLAEPLQILRGRLIAFAVTAAYVGLGQFAPLWSLAILAGLFLLMPWIVILSLRFRARNSAWRGLRFQFVGDTTGAVVNFLLLPILAVFTFGLSYPWSKSRQQDYIASGHRFGGRGFTFRRDVGEYYAVYLIALILLTGGVVLAVLLGLLPMIGPLLAMIVFYLVYFLFFAYIMARIGNLFWNNLRLDGHRFESRLDPTRLAWLYFSNTVAIALTIGLAIPWALIRMAQYRAECLSLIADGSLDDYVAEAGSEVGATGSELGEVLELDLGL